MSMLGDGVAPGFRPIRLETLVRLRWLAVAGQTLALLLVSLAFGFEVPLVPALGLVALSAALNVALLVRFGPAYRPSTGVALGQLAYDSVQLGALLWLTGGLENPFSILLLAPVTVSATSLPQRSTYLLAGLMIAIATGLGFSHMPLPWHRDAPIALEPLYVVGMWVALTLGMGFITAYANRVALEARQLADALAATELVLSRQSALSALDGLAAAAAHELGTPLSTIALAAKETRAELEPGPVADDLDLILNQVDRCRTILLKLRSLNTSEGDPFSAVPVEDLLAEIARPHRLAGKKVRISVDSQNGQSPMITRNVGLLHGLGNVVENAVQFARTEVAIAARCSDAGLWIEISDDGPGFAHELMARIGDPYLTTRPRDRADADLTEPGGLGLGVFIAKTLLERTGARLHFSNRSAAGHAVVTIEWPREALVALSQQAG